MTVTQPNFRELAKQGDPQAISTLINHSLQPKGITAKSTFHQGCLSILLESADVPNQSMSVAFIEKGIIGLESTVIQQVKVRGQRIGSKSVAWSQEFHTPYGQQILSERDNAVSGSPIASMQVDVRQVQKGSVEPSQRVWKVYQFLQIRVQLLGRGLTNEIMNLYVNGKRLHPKVKTMHEFMNYLGSLGFQVVTAELETEGVYTHFYTLQREAYTREPSAEEDIFDVLEKTKEGADFGDSVRQLLEFGLLGDNF